MIRHGPADDLAASGVQHDGAAQEAGECRHKPNVGTQSRLASSGVQFRSARAGAGRAFRSPRVSKGLAGSRRLQRLLECGGRSAFAPRRTRLPPSAGCRALAQLPITIDQDGYLVANGDFIEPVGPAFWERKS